MSRNIRYLVLLISVLCAVSFNIDAQTHYDGSFYVGGKAGASFSKIFFNPSVSQKIKTGTVAGVTIRYIEENHFGLIAEMNFEQRGWKEDFYESTQYKYSRTISYVQIPVLAHIYFGRKGRFFFNAGPEIGFCLGESTNTNFNVDELGSLPDFPTKKTTVDQMKVKVNHKVDFGISAGLGTEFFVNKKNSVYLEARFYYGLGNVLKSGRTESFSASNSMSLMATIGYWFRVK
jgi:hypothetical protein